VAARWPLRSSSRTANCSLPGRRKWRCSPPIPGRTTRRRDLCAFLYQDMPLSSRTPPHQHLRRSADRSVTAARPITTCFKSRSQVRLCQGTTSSRAVERFQDGGFSRCGAGAKAHINSNVPTARLKPCPDTNRTLRLPLTATRRVGCSTIRSLISRSIILDRMGHAIAVKSE